MVKYPFDEDWLPEDEEEGSYSEDYDNYEEADEWNYFGFEIVEEDEYDYES